MSCGQEKGLLVHSSAEGVGTVAEKSAGGGKKKKKKPAAGPEVDEITAILASLDAATPSLDSSVKVSTISYFTRILECA